MLQKLLELLTQVAGIGLFAMAIVEKAASLIKKRKTQREARKGENGPENK